MGRELNNLVDSAAKCSSTVTIALRQPTTPAGSPAGSTVAAGSHNQPERSPAMTKRQGENLEQRDAKRRSESSRDDSRTPLTVLANRLPLYIDANQQWQQSPGGLAKVLCSVLTAPNDLWIGCSGRGSSTDADKRTALPSGTTGAKCIELHIEEKDYKNYYEGFCNNTLWPLYHNTIIKPTRWRGDFDSYCRVNSLFAEQAARIAPLAGTVWIHDYHLQLVPKILRELRPDLKIGFFLHIPFPDISHLKYLPEARELLLGLMGADLIGTQTNDHARNFLTLVRDELNLSADGPVIHFDRQEPARAIHVKAFPIGIGAQPEARSQQEESEIIQDIRNRASSRGHNHLLLSVDRLDHTKGIVQRLNAIGELLSSGQLDPQATCFVQAVQLSRENLHSYHALKNEIEQLANNINQDYRNLDRPPIHYLCRNLDEEELHQLYRSADIMIVTPFQDGMNIVSKEYVAAHGDGTGALVLSKHAGSAQQLHDAWLVDPFSIDDIKRGILAALHASDETKSARMLAMYKEVTTRDARWWAQSFLEQLGTSI